MVLRFVLTMLMLAGLGFCSSRVTSGEEESPGSGEGWQVHQTIPDITLPDLDGTPRALRSFGGKKIFLVHFASW